MGVLDGNDNSMKCLEKQNPLKKVNTEEFLFYLKNFMQHYDICL